MRRRKKNSSSHTALPHVHSVQAGRRFGRSAWLLLLVICALSLTLNFIGLKWCLPNIGRPPCSDSIAGMHCLHHKPLLFKTWQSKYPRIHYIVNNAFYAPFVERWQESPVMARDRQGRVVQSVLNHDRINTLVIVSRVISACMGVLAVLACFLGARLLFDDDWIAFFSAMGLACAQQFVLYCHTGNVDIPSVFWFAWSFYLAVKIVKGHKWWPYILLPICGALAAGTKDANVVYVVGLAVSICVGLVYRDRAKGKSFTQAIKGLLCVRVLVAVMLFLFLFAMINNIITDWSGYKDRMAHWSMSGAGIKRYVRFNEGFLGQIKQLCLSWTHLRSGLGWPFLSAIVLSVIYGLIRFRWKCVFCLLPLVVFYGIVVVHIRFSEPRFFICGYVGLATVTGAATVAWLRWKRIPLVVRWLPIVFVYGTTFLYGLGVAMEIANDSRMRASQWLVDNVSKNTPIASLIRPAYGPYMTARGFTKYIYPWVPPGSYDKSSPLNSLPPYVLTGRRWLLAMDKQNRAKAFHKALCNDELPYRRVAFFSHKYLYPAKGILGFAGWPLDMVGHIPLSPWVAIYAREDLYPSHVKNSR